MPALFAWNPPLALALFALISVQLLKFVGTLILRKRLDLRRLVGTGGMPSSHSASASALATAVGLQVGWGSPLFAVATYFALVVLYDATGIRRAAGRQAAVLNRIIDELREHHTIEGERLRELLGHTPLEVLAGTTYGILVALALYP